MGATDTWNQNRVNLDKRVSELRSVSYVTVRPKAGDFSAYDVAGSQFLEGPGCGSRRTQRLIAGNDEFSLAVGVG